MRIFKLKKRISLVIASFMTAMTFAFICTSCNFEIVKVDDKTNADSGVLSEENEIIPPYAETTVPPALELPEIQEEAEDKDYLTAINNAFMTSELSSVSPKAKTEFPGVEVISYLRNQTDVEIPEAVKELILNFHTDRYACIGGLRFISTAQYFDTSKITGKFYSIFNDTVTEYLIYARKKRTADLSYNKAVYRVTINEAEKTQNGYKFKYTLNDAVDFSCSEVTSYSGYMEAYVIIEKDKNGIYRFVQYAEDTDVNLLFEEQVMDYLGYDYEESYLRDITISASVQSNRMMYGILKKQKEVADKNIEGQKKILERVNKNPENYILTVKPKSEYDAEAAVAYSYQWAGTADTLRNPYYTDYSIYGGNCQNYVSQCLLAGGIPMDITGNYEQQWKWYSDYSNHYPTAWGRVPSWAGTEYFYEYCKKNIGTGLVTQITKYIYCARPGDVIQYVVDDWTRHSVIVSGIIYDDAGNVVEILVNSNTTDHVDYPLTAYGYTDIRLIRIAGYN